MVEEQLVVQVFVRTPILGRVKTRLVPLLGAKGAFELHLELTEQLFKSLKTIDASIEVWTDLNPNDPFLNSLGYPVKQQVGADLGNKMSYALASGLMRYERVVLVGTDLPEINDQYLKNVFRKLDIYSTVIGPALDGGFGLIAVKKFNSSIFDGIVWGGPRVLRDLIRNIMRAKLEYCLAPLLYDVDVPADYARYQKWLRQP